MRDGKVARAPSSDARSRANIIAGLAAVVAVIGAAAVVCFAERPDFRDASTTITETTEVVEGGDAPGTTTTTSRETETAASDSSALGRLFGAPGAGVLLTVGLVVLAAFLVGAFVQRVMLGAYGLTLGPITIPDIPAVKPDEAAAAVGKITGSPELVQLFRTSPGRVIGQPHPLFHSIEDPRLQFLSIRTELEARLRDLASASGIDRDVALSKLLARLQAAQTIDAKAREGLQQLLDLGDRAAAGAAVSREVLTSIAEEASRILNVLGEMADKPRGNK